MILKITNDTTEPALGEFKICLEDLADKARHPFIATTKWDIIYVDVEESTPCGFLRPLVGKTIIKPIIKTPITAKTMRVLCEILPDNSAKIRATYMKGIDAFTALLTELSEEYNW